MTAIFMIVLVVAGCARPGESAGDGGSAPDGELEADASPSVQLASCVYQSAAQPASPEGDTATQKSTVTMTATRRAPALRPSASASPDGGRGERERAEAFERNRSANKAFRERGPIPSEVRSASQPCVEEVRRGLSLFGPSDKYGEGSLRRVLTAAGLFEITVRPAGRLDAAGSGGLLYAGWTGQACVFGEYGPNLTTVDLGSRIADGGCLPAAD